MTDLHILITITSAVTLLYASYVFRHFTLLLSYNYFFSLFLATCLLYFHLSPTIYCLSSQVSPEYISSLWKVSLLSLIFFEVPFVVIYEKMVKKTKLPINAYSSPYNISVRLMAFAVLAITIAAIFLYISVEYGLFFRRIGHQSLAAHSLNAPRLGLYFYRSFMEVGIFVIVASLMVFRLIRKDLTKATKILLTATIFAYSSLFFIHSAINSRLNSMLILTALYFFIVIKKRSIASSHKLRKSDLILFPAVLFLGLSVPTISRSIIYWQMTDKSEGIFSILQKETPIYERTNGLDLLTKIYPRVEEQGLAWGRAWLTPLSVYYFLVSDREKYQEMKKNMFTSSKSWIAKTYLNDQSPDFYSSILTDAYANFGIIGLLFLSLAFATAYVLIDNAAHSDQLSPSVFVGLYFLQAFLLVERDVIGIAINLLLFSLLPITLGCALFVKKTTTTSSGLTSEPRS